MWRGIARIIPRLAIAQAQAAERVYAPNGAGFRSAQQHFHALQRHLMLAEAEVRLGNVAMAILAKVATEKPLDALAHQRATADGPPRKCPRLM